MTDIGQTEHDKELREMPTIDVDIFAGSVRLKGEWTIATISTVDQSVRKLTSDLVSARLPGAGEIALDLSDVSAIDPSGAYLISRLIGECKLENVRITQRGASKETTALLSTIDEHLHDLFFDSKIGEVSVQQTDNDRLKFWEWPFVAIGRVFAGVGRDFILGMNIIGAAIQGPQMHERTGRSGLRLTSIVHHIDRIGVRAVPIVALMSFLVGAIIAQQGAFQLRIFGLESWSVDLVSVLILREVGVLLTAIMVAGRSGSAMTAEIGAMKMREEIDALSVVGLSPIGVLIFPRLVALTIALPLLSFVANMAALAGAALLLWLYSGIGFDDFLIKLRAFVDLSTVFSGLIKTPFMAMIIGVLATTEGMKVRGSADSLGRRTTAAVVKSIFFVIVIDGFFAIFYAAIDY